MCKADVVTNMVATWECILRPAHVRQLHLRNSILIPLVYILHLLNSTGVPFISTCTGTMLHFYSIIHLGIL